MPVLAWYVSGHGFGHASRDIEVLNALATEHPDIEVHVRTSVPPWLFALTARGTLAVSHAHVDTGVAQRGSLEVDLERTIAEARRFYHAFDAHAEAEAAWLRGIGADLVVADMPPVAFDAATRAGIPSAALGNFTWDWIYGHYGVLTDELPWLPRLIADTHALARRAWRLPMHGGFEGFRAIVDVPLVARRSAHTRAAARAALGIDTAAPLVLVSFGGFGLEGLPLDTVARHNVAVMTTTVDGPTSAEPGPSLVWRRPDGVYLVDEHRLYAEGLRYEDLVRAADVVVSKPGYGIISECAANDAALLYTARGDFIEYDVLVAEMPALIRCQFISNADLLAGGWREELEALLGSDRPPAPRVDGAEVVATAIANLLGDDPGGRRQSSQA